jgi:hypothetical protein
VALQTPVCEKLAELDPRRFRFAGLSVLRPHIQQQIPLELLAAAIALTAALCFSFALSATLWFKRGLQPMRTGADLKGIQAYWCHFMLQPGAILWFKAHERRSRNPETFLVPARHRRGVA